MCLAHPHLSTFCPSVETYLYILYFMGWNPPKCWEKFFRFTKAKLISAVQAYERMKQMKDVATTYVLRIIVNTFATWVLPQTRLGSLQCSSNPLAGFRKGGRERQGSEGRGRWDPQAKILATALYFSTLLREGRVGATPPPVFCIPKAESCINPLGHHMALGVCVVNCLCTLITWPVYRRN